MVGLYIIWFGILVVFVSCWSLLLVIGWVLRCVWGVVLCYCVGVLVGLCVCSRCFTVVGGLVYCWLFICCLFRLVLRLV